MKLQWELILSLGLTISLLGVRGCSALNPANSADAPAQPSLAADGIPEPTATVKVDSLRAMQNAIDSATPGEQIVLTDGVYTSVRAITIGQRGNEQHPIIISAQSISGVEIKGSAGFTFTEHAAYIVLRGFVFSHSAGAVMLPAGLNHCRVTRNLFQLAVAPKGRSVYMEVSGDDCEVDHNEFRDKNTEGEMLIVLGPGNSGMAKHTWIHHNYFHDFKSPPANNCSAIQIGLSGRSMSSGFSITEHNLFIRCAGENEGCICNKSSDNIYRFNTFGEGSTECSIRHGNRCQIYANFFLDCQGIRFFGHDHLIYSNYFQGCDPAIHIGNGDGIIPPAKLTAHDQPVGEKVVFNTLVNNKRNIVMQGRDLNGLGAKDITIADNIIQSGPKAGAIAGPLLIPTWQSNIIWDTNGGVGDIPSSAVISVNPEFKPDSTGQFRVQSSSPILDKAAGTFTFVTVDVNGRARGLHPTPGAEQFSNAVETNHILNPADVGINAVEHAR